jgi:hypothetical protein
MCIGYEAECHLHPPPWPPLAAAVLLQHTSCSGAHQHNEVSAAPQLYMIKSCELDADQTGTLHTLQLALSDTGMAQTAKFPAAVPSKQMHSACCSKVPPTTSILGNTEQQHHPLYKVYSERRLRHHATMHTCPTRTKHQPVFLNSHSEPYLYKTHT